MKLIEDVKKAFGYNFLKSKIKKQQRNRSFNNFDSARSIGVLFDASHQESYLIVKSFIESLRNSKTEAFGLGYVLSQDALNYFPYHKDIDFFCIKDIKWNYEPKAQLVYNFIQKSFDIFIDLTYEDLLTLKFITGQVDAKLKVGHGDSNDTYFDFIINQKDQKLDFLLNQIKHYMSAMKMKT